ncbi:MAG TPA: hypothetical protein VJJ48_02365 [Candidatus Paceibacterota bacterium]
MLIRVSPVRETGSANDQYLGRLARAQDQGRVADPELIDAMLKRGRSRRVSRHQSLAERDGDWN